MTYEWVYVTIHYGCGHDALRPKLIGLVGRRECWTRQRCCHCSELRERRYAMAREEQQAREEERWPVSPDGTWPPVARVVAS